MYVCLCCGVYIKKPTFLKPDGISCTLGEREIYDIYADTFVDSGLWLSKVRKNVFRNSQSNTKLLLLLLLVCGDIEPYPGPTNTDIEELHIEELSSLLKHRGFKIFHQNVRRLLTYIDKVKILFRDFKKHRYSYAIRNTHQRRHIQRQPQIIRSSRV